MPKRASYSSSSRLVRNIFGPGISIKKSYTQDNASLLVPHPVDGATVFTASSDLLRAGIEIGMSLYQARQIAPSAIIVEPGEAEYHARHDAIFVVRKNP